MKKEQQPMEENCENCRYSRGKYGDLRCHRRAPVPYNALTFHIAEIIRDMAWIVHVKETGDKPDEYDDLNKESTEAPDYSVWPQVEIDEWCGEWKGKTE